MALTEGAHLHTLRGACSCGRNQYAINLPDSDTDAMSVILDNSAASRRAHSAPLAAYVSIPLEYYQSATFAFYPDETHRDIRRTYDVPSSYSQTVTTSSDGTTSQTTTIRTPTESQQRHFCGYCGTHFSTWSSSESRAEEADQIRVALESIREEDFPTLYALGVLFDDEEEDEEDEDTTMSGNAQQAGGRKARRHPSHSGGSGRTWFETMTSGSQLGRRRGHGHDVEVEEADGDDSPTGKRKREA